jgi:flagellar export protein FliJ
MPVPFRFETVLQVREAERDRCRLALVQEQRREASLLAELNRVSAERQAVQDDLRAMQDGNGWTVDRVVACQQRSEHLAAELGRIQITLLELSVTLQRCHRELLEADTATKVLEKLAGRHEADQRRVDQAKEQRDIQDWRAA